MSFVRLHDFFRRKTPRPLQMHRYQDLRREFGRAKLERGQNGGHVLTVAGQTYNLRRSCRTFASWSDGHTDLVFTEAEDGMTHDS